MSPGYEPGLVMKILHLNVKDHMAVYKLMIWRWGPTIRQDVESNTHIFYLLLNRITSKRCASGAIDGIRLLDCLGDFNPILVSAFMVWSASALNQGDYPVSLLEDPADPPVKCGFISNLCSKCELSNLKQMGLFQVRLTMVFGPQRASIEARNSCCSWNRAALTHYSELRAQTVERSSHSPLAFIIREVIARSMLGPRYLPSTRVLSGKATPCSQNLTHSQKPYSQKGLMPAVSPETTVSGT
jgi:hypothetical protein